MIIPLINDRLSLAREDCFVPREGSSTLRDFQVLSSSTTVLTDQRRVQAQTSAFHRGWSWYKVEGRQGGRNGRHWKAYLLWCEWSKMLAHAATLGQGRCRWGRVRVSMRSVVKSVLVLCLWARQSQRECKVIILNWRREMWLINIAGEQYGAISLGRIVTVAHAGGAGERQRATAGNLTLGTPLLPRAERTHFSGYNFFSVQ